MALESVIHPAGCSSMDPGASGVPCSERIPSENLSLLPRYLAIHAGLFAVQIPWIPYSSAIPSAFSTVLPAHLPMPGTGCFSTELWLMQQ